MIQFFILLCVCLVIGGSVVYLVQQGSGYFLIVWGDTSIEMSLWFGVFSLLLVVLLVWLSLYIFRYGIRGIISTKNKITGYGVHKAQKMTTAGLVHFIEGDWQAAYKKLTRSANKVDEPIINYLAAARCAYEVGDEHNALQLLHKAEKSASNSELAVALTQARMQIANQQYEQALATLQRISLIKPDHGIVLSLQQKLYVELHDWLSVKELLPRLHQQKIGTVKERYYLEKTIHHSMLKESIVKAQSLSLIDAAAQLDKEWRKIPEHFQRDVEVRTDFINELIRCKKYNDAQASILSGLNQQWCDQWVVLYGLLTPKDAPGALTIAESWLKNQAENASLMLTLGRLCLYNQQWGRAKDFFEKSIRLSPQAEAYAELARLHNFLGNEQESQQACRQGLLSSISSLSAVVDFEK